MVREFVLQRFSDNRESTLGVMVKVLDTAQGRKTVFQGYTLEDQFNEIKVQKETRIPAGKYEIIINQAETPKTKVYQARYSWFKKHLQLKDVPGFQGIYVHVGNKDTDTDGCILMADTAGNNVIGDNGISQSTACFMRFYLELYEWLENKNQAFIHILDEKMLLP
jgi:hypothetical protein